MRARVRLGLALLLLGACGGNTDRETPEAALHRFLRAMERSHFDTSARADAYEMLCESTRAELARRAEQASSASRELAPWEMIVPGRFRRRFAARPERMESRIDGSRATVIVRSNAGQKVEVPLVREDGRWRVVLRLPGAAPKVPAAVTAAAAEAAAEPAAE